MLAFVVLSCTASWTDKLSIAPWSSVWLLLHCRVVVLRCLREVCADGQLLVDLFVNYDCDLGSSNLFERLVTGLVKMAQAALPATADQQQLQQEQWLRQEALQCLASATEALLEWYRESSGQELPPLAAAGDG